MATSGKIPSIAVNACAAKRLRSGHPWVYRSDLAAAADGKTPAAALVHVTGERGRFLASALSSSSSQIALRLITDQPLLSERDLHTLLQQRIATAAAYRRRFVKDSDAYRLIFSEADALPGLIVDRYNDVFTMQVLTQAMDREDIRATVVQALQSEANRADQDWNLVERVDSRIRELEELPAAESKLIAGSKTSTIFHMNGMRFHFDAMAGQKTGGFLDQRENYLAAAQYARGEALDVFCYQGGFALHLARVCDRVTGVDSSRPALEVADQNAVLNSGHMKCGEVEWIEANAFDLLKDYASAGKLYDTIVLDPPAFAKSKRTLPTALRGYKELNLRALKMLRPGGILVTNSCSHHVSESDFFGMIASAASDAHRTLRILEKRAQSKDHPVSATIPETAYLKCVICVAD